MNAKPQNLELYTEILTDNKKGYGSTNRRRVESNSNAQRGNDRAGQRDIQSVSKKTEESGGLSEEVYASSRRRREERNEKKERLIN
jgi:hypothetical protein